MQRLLKWLIGLAVIGAAAWSAWWYAGARGQEAGIDAWLAAQRDRGWQAETGALAVEGFPWDFRLTVHEIALADPRAGWAWQAPIFEAASKSYEPTRIAVTWPGEQILAVPGDRAEVRSARMETLLDLRPGPAMELREAASEVEALAISGQTGWRAGAEQATLRLVERPEDLAPPNSYDIRLVATDLELPKHLVERIDPTGWLKPKIGQLTLIGHGALDEPLARRTIEEGRVALRAATIREAGFEWGEMRLTLSGAFTVDDDGFPDGQINVEAREWRQMLRLAVRSGVLSRSTADTVEQGIELLGALTGGVGDNLKAPLGLKGGKIRLGIFAIADAPRLAPPRYR